MTDYLTTDTELTSVADAIRTKGGTSAALTYPTGFVSAIEAIPTGGTMQSKSVTPTETAQTVTPDTGYDGLSSVSVGAISSSYIGSGITQRSSSDLTVSGATVTAPAGYYAASASKSVADGIITLHANRSAVSNNSVSVTPSAVVGAGYIHGGSITGEATTVSASQLVSGTLNITSNNTYDVTNYASAIVNVSGGGGAWQDVSSHFTYYDGTSTVEITALKNGDMVILLVTVTATEAELDGRIAIDQGYGPAAWFASPDGYYSLSVYIYDTYSDSYMCTDYASFNNGEFDLVIATPTSVIDSPVYLIGAYLVN